MFGQSVVQEHCPAVLAITAGVFDQCYEASVGHYIPHAMLAYLHDDVDMVVPSVVNEKSAAVFECLLFHTAFDLSGGLAASVVGHEAPVLAAVGGYFAVEPVAADVLVSHELQAITDYLIAQTVGVLHDDDGLVASVPGYYVIVVPDTVVNAFEAVLAVVLASHTFQASTRQAGTAKI